MNESTQSPAMAPDMLGTIILTSRAIESMLHTACPAEVAGIHALTELLSSRLPEETKRQLHYIATVRNRAAHEDNFVLSPDEFERYKQTAAAVQSTLSALFPAPGAEKKSEGEQAATPDPEQKLAVEKELWGNILRKLSLLGYFPVAGIIYLFFLFISAVFAQAWVVLLTLLYVCAAVLGIRGWNSAMDRGLLYVGIAGSSFAYITVMILAFKAPVKGCPRWLGILPGVNVLYLPLRWLRDLHWGKFGLSLAGLGSFGACIYSVMRGFYQYALWGMAAVWVLSISCSIIWGRKHEE